MKLDRAMATQMKRELNASTQNANSVNSPFIFVNIVKTYFKYGNKDPYVSLRELQRGYFRIQG